GGPQPSPPGQAQRAWRSDGLHGNAVQAGPPHPPQAGEGAKGGVVLLLPPRAGEGRDGGKPQRQTFPTAPSAFPRSQGSRPIAILQLDSPGAHGCAKTRNATVPANCARQ